MSVDVGHAMTSVVLLRKGSGALRAVLLVLRFDRLARPLPVGIAPVAQLVEAGAGGERLRAVKRDGFAIDPVAAAGDQEGGEVVQLLHRADAAERVYLLG